MCLPLLVVNLLLLNKAIGPKKTNLISLPFAYLFLKAACNSSKLNLKRLPFKLLTESPLGILL